MGSGGVVGNFSLCEVGSQVSNGVVFFGNTLLMFGNKGGTFVGMVQQVLDSSEDFIAKGNKVGGRSVGSCLPVLQSLLQTGGVNRQQSVGHGS